MNLLSPFLVSFLALLFILPLNRTLSSTEERDKAGAVASDFINAYVKALPQCDGYLGAVAWVKQNPLASPGFKKRLEQLYRKALKDDPEMGYGADAVLGAQDYPEAYTVHSVRIEGDQAMVELQGMPPLPSILHVILVRNGDSWLVDASGDLIKPAQATP